MQTSQRLAQLYIKTAVIVFNTLILLVLFNLLLLILFTVKDYFEEIQLLNKVTEQGHPLKEIYPNLDERELYTLWKETWSRPFIDEDFTGFKERPYNGKYVNVHEAGFRYTKNQGEWPPDPKRLTVFLFGGSTTFGYGVPDNQTVASFLQEIFSAGLGRDVRIYNFGRGAYYSTQERILFEELLTAGFIPDVAIFIDGVNDLGWSFGGGRPLKLEVAQEYTLIEAFGGTVSKLPIYRAALFLKRKIRHMMNSTIDYDQHKSSTRETLGMERISRFIKNKKIIDGVSSVYRIKPVFVWQPIPSYKYDLQYYRNYSDADREEFSYSNNAYQKMLELSEQGALGENFLWCAGIQEHKKEPLYIDLEHYAPNLSKLLAQCIFDLSMERKLLEARKQ